MPTLDDHQILEQTIEMISRLMGELETEAFKQEGFSDLSMRQLLYLETIARMERPTFSEVADELSVTKPSVTAIIQKLIGLGYVTKVQSEQDRRAFHIILTPKGEQLSEMHDNIHKMLAKRLTQNLTEPEIHQMAALMRKIIAG